MPAIRSLIISYKLLGTREWFVIHHTGCGMRLFTDDVLADLLSRSLETASLVGPANWIDVGDGPIRTHPLVPESIPIYAYIYDVKSGRLIAVPSSAQAGSSATLSRELAFDDG